MNSIEIDQPPTAGAVAEVRVASNASGGHAVRTPVGARSFDELSVRLRALQAWTGLSYREVHRLVLRSRRQRGVPELPAFNTVYRCLQRGRHRLDVELVVDVARALTGDDRCAEEWRQAYRVVAGLTTDGAVVEVSDRLPADNAGFIGRNAELAAVLRESVRSAPTIVTIEGMPGVGKSTLAVRAAHLLVCSGIGRDLQLSVDLRGFDRDRPPADPGAILVATLRQLGVPSRSLTGLAQERRSALLRATLSGRRALLLLDDACDEDQVRPLIPNSPGCVVLVTSRRRLRGLPGTHLELDVFSVRESVQLLGRRIGAARIGAEQEAAIQIADVVGRLPLALAVVASRIEAVGGWSLADHRDRLADRRADLRLDDGVELALAASYEGLAEASRRMLRCLSLHPGGELDVYAAAALADVPVPTAEQQLDELTTSSLVRQRTPGRYEMHDLVRAFAAARGRDEDPSRRRQDALTRLHDHYRCSAAAAMNRYAPYEGHGRPDVPESGTSRPEFPDRAGALAWLDTERANLVAVAVHAADRGWPEHATDLSGTLFRYLDDGAHFHDGEVLHSAAVRSAVDRTKGNALSNLGVVRWRLGQYREALECYAEELAIARGSDDRQGEARALHNVGLVNERLGRYRDAVACYRRSMCIKDELGLHAATSAGLQNLAHVYERLGRYEEAVRAADRCIEISHGIGDRITEGRALNSRGLANLGLGRGDQAIADCEAARAIARELRNRIGEGYAATHLARAARGVGLRGRALQLQREALDIAVELGNLDGEAQVLNDIGASLLRDRDFAAATEHYRKALTIAERIGDPYERARACQGLGDTTEYEDGTRALVLWQRALELFDDMGTPEAAGLRVRCGDKLVGVIPDQKNHSRPVGGPLAAE